MVCGDETLFNMISREQINYIRFIIGGGMDIFLEEMKVQKKYIFIS